MKRPSAGVITAIVIAIAAALGLFTVSPSRAQEATPNAEATAIVGELGTFTPSECAFGATSGFTCGYVTVPEQRADAANTNTIQIAVAVYQSPAGEAPTDPLMILAGGPGERFVQSAALLAPVFETIAGSRDIIFFDQRGVGLSLPALECSEWVEVVIETIDDPIDAEVSLSAFYDAITACGDRLEAEGINLAAYNTTENAADVADIAAALGEEQVNLLGVSYGSLLAQAVLRDHPEVVRSVIIDSVLPASRSLFLDAATTANDAVLRLVRACAADAACNEAYPDLENTLYETVERLNAEPVPLDITNPVTGESYTIQFNGEALTGVLQVFLYQTPAIPVLPAVIQTVSEGDYSIAAQLQGQFLALIDGLSRGMQFSVQCSEDLIGRDAETEFPEIIAALPDALEPASDPLLQVEYFPIGICDAWGVPELDASVKTLVTSDIPALVLAGEFDPVTPPGYAEEVAANLTNSTFVEIPSVGHSVNLSSPCAASISAAFLLDPAAAVDRSCVAEIAPIAFVIR